MKRKLVIGLLVVSVLIAVFYLLWPSDEARIRKLFKEGASAVESRDLESIMSKVSFAYQDENGVTYPYLKEILKREFDRLSDIQVEYEALRVEIIKKGGLQGERLSSDAPDMAKAEMDIRVVATVGTETGYILGDVKTPVHMKFTLEKARMKWLIVKTEGIMF
ncbi:MAG TPA: hypothetical protein VEI46_01515 [Thermodesulfovibrionales bacterium]|nr:hypothetical protein [Thermodesulfovibrionales bacterium]